MRPTTLILGAASCAFIVSCGTPLGRLNPGAAVPYITVTDAQMAVVAAAHIAPGKVTIGLCDGRCVWELSNGADASTAAHECAHLADMNGGSYRAAIDLLTPPNPSEHMRKRLASMEWVNAQGPNYWRTIGDRWGKSAVGHPDILARIYPPP